MPAHERFLYFASMISNITKKSVKEEEHIVQKELSTHIDVSLAATTDDILVKNKGKKQRKLRKHHNETNNKLPKICKFSSQFVNLTLSGLIFLKRDIAGLNCFDKLSTPEFILNVELF